MYWGVLVEGKTKYLIDKEFVNEKLENVYSNEDTSRYIL